LGEGYDCLDPVLDNTDSTWNKDFAPADEPGVNTVLGKLDNIFEVVELYTGADLIAAFIRVKSVVQKKI
jgi:hypothetical protein